jgi:hypothetical protein
MASLKLVHLRPFYLLHIKQIIHILVGRDSSVGIATHYGLDGPGIESRWGVRFSAPVQTSPGAHPPSYTMRSGSFSGLKRPGRGVVHPPPSSAEDQEKVEIYFYSPSGPSCTVLGWSLPFNTHSCVLCYKSKGRWFDPRWCHWIFPLT